MKNKVKDFSKLQSSLYYLHIAELRNCCIKLSLSIKGKKVNLVSRIVHFLKTGEKTDIPEYPPASMAKRKKVDEPKPEDLMLKGAYKNDLKNRIFFKGLIGEHFHYTAFGIDWLEERWLQGKPPTYQEFANMWQNEYAFRRENGSEPKKEWAYINFVKLHLNENPNASRHEILKQWERERNSHKTYIDEAIMS